MSRTPNSRKEETHERIVAAAARSIRERGYSGLGVADVMKDAGLTHGGFYAHFESRETLLVEALEQAWRESAETMARATARRANKRESAFRSLVETYLADAALASKASGCPVAALSSEIPRQSQAVRDASAGGVRRLIDFVRTTLPDAPEAAVAVASTLVGALQLARALGNNAEGRAALSQARAALLGRYDTATRVH